MTHHKDARTCAYTTVLRPVSIQLA